MSSCSGLKRAKASNTDAFIAEKALSPTFAVKSVSHASGH